MTATISGTRCRIRPVERSDYVERLPAWFSDREVSRYVVRAVVPQGLEDFVAAHDALRASSTDLEWGIETTEGSTVGLIGLHQLNWIARSAELRVLIGERSAWGQGIGTEATQLLVAYAFESLNLHKVWLGVNERNVGARTTYERSGFRSEGVLRDDVYRNGRYYDVVRMSILREEYEEAAPGWATFDELCRQLRDSG